MCREGSRGSRRRAVGSSYRWQWLIIVAVLAVNPWHPSQGQEGAEPLGDDVQINTYTVFSQRYPSVASSSSGRFVVIWESAAADNGDNSNSSVQGQLFDPEGNPEGAQFLVNSYVFSAQKTPDVAMSSSGRFVVVWEGPSTTDFSSTGIIGQLFSSDGSPLGEEFLVNTYTTDRQKTPVVAMDAAGGFVVVWESRSSSSGDISSIQGQRFASSGSMVGGQFQVNTFTDLAQDHPDIGMSDSGEFVVVWESSEFPGDDFGALVGRRFDAQGQARGPDFLVNSYTTGSQETPVVAVAEQGSFVVTWTSIAYQGSDYFNEGVQVQRFAQDGLAIGEPFRANVNTLWNQGQSRITIDKSGNFVIAWNSLGSYGTDDDVFSVQARVFRPDGSPVSEPFQVNTYTTGSQGEPSLTADDSGKFVVVWRATDSPGNDNDQYSIQGRRFCGPICGFVFGDGFETGDVTSWSQAAGAAP